MSAEVPHPAAMLTLLCQLQPRFASALRDAHARSPSSSGKPWSFLFYADEATPGNMLVQDQTRRCWNFYFQWREFPSEILTREHAWLLAGCLRAKVAKEVAGGVGTAWGKLLESFFAPGADFSRGVLLRLGPDERIVLTCQLGYFLGDEAALKALWRVKGASGWRPCMKCGNVVAARSGLADDTLVSAADTSLARVTLNTDTSFLQLADSVASKWETETTKGEKQQWEIACGFTYHPESLLWRPALRRHLRPISQTLFDWVHIFLVGGIANVALWQWFTAAFQVGLRFRDIAEFFESWNWPARIQGSPAKLWTDARERSCREAGVFKCGASDFISIYPVFREMISVLHFADMPNMRDHTSALLAVFRCLDIMVAAPGRRDAGNLQVAVEECLAASAKANPTVFPIPKYHYALHLPGQLAATGAMDGTLVHERKHKLFKRLATSVTNVTRYEKRLALTMVNCQLAAFAEEDVRPGRQNNTGDVGQRPPDGERFPGGGAGRRGGQGERGEGGGRGGGGGRGSAGTPVQDRRLPDAADARRCRGIRRPRRRRQVVANGLQRREALRPAGCGTVRSGPGAESGVPGDSSGGGLCARDGVWEETDGRMVGL